MPRTVVPPVRLRGPAPGQAVGGDGLPERLVKYVPAETLAFFVPLAAGIGDKRDGLLLTVVGAGLAGTVGYLWTAGQRAKPDERPRAHFYPLAGVSFLCWALGTSPNVAALVRLDPVESAVALGLAVFLVPLLDDVLNRWPRPRPARGRSRGGRARR